MGFAYVAASELPTAKVLNVLFVTTKHLLDIEKRREQGDKDVLMLMVINVHVAKSREKSFSLLTTSITMVRLIERR